MNDKATITPTAEQFPGAKVTEIPNAGVNYPDHDPVNRAAPRVKKDRAAAGELPELYKRLTDLKALKARLEVERLDVYQISLTVGGDHLTIPPGDRAKMGEAVKTDIDDAIAMIEGKIKGLGFDAG